MSDVPLEVGDIISIDIGSKHNGWIGDAAWTYAIRECSDEARRLMDVGKESLRRHPRRCSRRSSLAGRRLCSIASRTRLDSVWSGGWADTATARHCMGRRSSPRGTDATRRMARRQQGLSGRHACRRRTDAVRRSSSCTECTRRVADSNRRRLAQRALRGRCADYRRRPPGSDRRAGCAARCRWASPRDLQAVGPSDGRAGPATDTLSRQEINSCSFTSHSFCPHCALAPTTSMPVELNRRMSIMVSPLPIISLA